MDKAIISLLLLLNFGPIIGQSFDNLITTDGGKFFYNHTENNFEIDESKIEDEKIRVETTNGEIKRFSKGKYMLKPNTIGLCTITIYNEDKSREISSKEFLVIASLKPEVKPMFNSNETKITDNEIPKNKLEDLRGFYTVLASQNHIIFIIDEIDLMLYTKESGVFEFKTDGKLSDEIKEKIKALNEGDLIVLKNIKVKSMTDFSKKTTPDQIINIPPTVYFVK